MNLLSLTLFISFPAPVPKSNPAEIRKQIESQWGDLLVSPWSGVRKSYAAVVKLSSRPKDTTAFLAETLKPLTLDAERAKKMIRNLGSDDEKVWKAAFETFQYFDPRLAFDLKECVDEAPNVLARQRLGAVCIANAKPDQFSTDAFSVTVADDLTMHFIRNAGAANAATWVVDRTVKKITKREWPRVLIAIDLLEHFGTAESLAVLKSMATGHPEAGPTIAAKEALQRFEGK